MMNFAKFRALNIEYGHICIIILSHAHNFFFGIFVGDLLRHGNFRIMIIDIN